MNVCMDIQAGLGQTGGIGRYVRELFRHLGTEAAAGDVGQSADGCYGSRRRIRHAPAREEASDMQRDLRRDGRDKSSDGVNVGV